MKNLKKLFLPVLAAAFLAAPAQAADTLMMATTTSTQDTGLLEFLAPTFQKETGIELKWVAVGTGKALEIATTHLDERMAHETELRDYVIDRVLKNIPEARLNGGRSPRLPNNVNISFPGLEGETILLDLDMHGICASTGSACNSDSLDPSHVLLSIGVPEEIGHGSMRFTFGPQNTMEEAKYLCDVLEEVIPRRRAMSCMWLQGQNTARHFSLKGEQ